MRYTMGRWIDGLTDDERDVLITAPAMNDGDLWWSYGRGCGCLVGTVRGGAGGIMSGGVFWSPGGEWARWERACHEHGSMMGVPWRDAPESIRYPLAVARFGVARVVRAVKARAARGNRVHVPARETVGAA